ncbi:MoxR family ATPase [bacterium]|nr:MoxR family ATPase [Akkermansiaceae bacterium]MDB4300117.1 MoxR family ATPase [bacterium]MDB4295841.1 MoxR family ATPase [Akkermansiaceae bacterium]MDB4311407.1 MoxR family ATPase [bacterium]MDB4320129.1 MoxR family ATPase [Akkermansiaceae bacterium]
MTTDIPAQPVEPSAPDVSAQIQERSAFIAPLRAEIGRVLIGQDHFVDRMLVCLLTGNHLLVEGLPGLAKTLAVNTLAQALTAQFGRIQFTPDLLPADVIGTHIYNPGTQEFKAKEGPIFTNLLLADEINRAPAKVQSALLEAMQEKQVTLGGETRQLPRPFLVMATQNPLDQEGTYPLPEAQMDRFMMKVIVGYPKREEEREVLRRMSSTTKVPSASPVADLAAVMAARELIDQVKIDPRIEDYILDIVFATREEGRAQLSERQSGVDLSAMDQLITAGASPRATLQLTRGARCLAFLDGRDYVLPEDVKGIAADILRHRIIPSYEAQAENMDTDALISQILDTLVAP